MNQGIWQSFLQYCEQKWERKVTLEAIDLPGFGIHHELDIDPYNIDSVTELVKHSLRPNTVVLGWSMGGLVSQRLADTRDPNVIAQIQIASSPKFVQTDDWFGIRKEVLAQFKQQLSADHLQLLKRFLSIQCIGLDKPKEQMKTMLEAICQFPLSSSKTLSKSLKLLSDTDLRPTTHTLPNSTLPTLRIFGGFDSLIPQKKIPAIEHLYPNDCIYLIPKASHAPFLSHPELCFNAIDVFLKPYIGQSNF
jgi:pimeloyl-[acyl-carrier protein] methyl ester esterase